MALPTAPLGQLPNMSMPYSIPTYDKGPSIWEKALASFLVNAAGGAAQQGVDNVMSRDYAGEFGETKAGGLSKLINGPQVRADDAKIRRQQAFTREENELAREATAGQNEADAANALLRLDRQAQTGSEMQALQDMNADLRTSREITAADTRTSTQSADRSALARLEAELYGKRPDVLSGVARDNAAADEARARTEFQRQIMGSIKLGTAGNKSATTPIDQVEAAITEQQASTPEQRELQALLASPQGRAKYPTGSDLMGKITIADILRMIPPPESY